MRSEDDVAKMEAEQAQIQQAQAMLASMEQASNVAKNLGAVAPGQNPQPVPADAMA
jgi:type II secretory pathway component PulM